MDKTLKIILSIIVIVGGVAILYTFFVAQSGSHDAWGLEYAPLGIAIGITAPILSIILTVATLGALIRREYKDPLKRKYFFKLLTATIAVDALIVFYGIKIFF